MTAAIAFFSWYSYSDNAPIFTHIALPFQFDDKTINNRDLIGDTVKNLLDYNCFKYLIDRCLLPNPMIEHFWALLLSYKQIIFFTDEESWFSTLIQIINPLINCLNNLDSKDFDETILNDIIDTLYDFAPRFLPQANNEYTQIFDFLYDCLKSETLKVYFFYSQLILAYHEGVNRSPAAASQ